MVNVSNRSNFHECTSRSDIASMVTPSRRDNNNDVPRTVEVQRVNEIVSSELLFLYKDTITSKSNHVDLVSPPIQENSHALPPVQENILTAHLHEDSNFDTLNLFPNSDM